MLPSTLWRGMGADTDQLRAILNVKLMLDDRKPMTLGRQRKEKKEKRNGILTNMFISLCMGLLYTFPLIFLMIDSDSGKDNTVFALTLYFSMFLFMLSFLLITDFSNILFDTRDKYIIFPRPINDKTLFLSRMLHVFIYLFRVIVPMSIPGWIVLGIVHGWKSVVLFPLPLFCLVFIALFIVNGCYLLLLKLTKPERFKEVINYFQIVLSVILFIMGYLMPRVMQSSFIQHVDLNTLSWVRFLPPYWLASCFIWLGHTAPIAGTQWYGTLAIIVPVVCLWVTVKWLAPQFARNIGAIDTVEVTEQTNVSTKKTASSAKYYTWLANLLNRTDDAKAGFIITWLQTSRSRSFKMRVYPMFAYVPVYFVYMLTLDRNRSLSETWQELPNKPKFLVLLYMCVVVVTQALNYLTVSDQYKASWVYYAAPVDKPGKIMSGAFKAIWVKFFLPFWGIIALFVLYIWGPARILDIILAVSNMTLFALCIMRVGYRILPFSTQEQMNNASTRFLRVFIMLGVPGLLGFGHYMAVDIWWLKVLFLALSSILLWLVWDSYANTTWENARKADI